jgi:hypothetical protein
MEMVREIVYDEEINTMILKDLYVWEGEKFIEIDISKTSLE